jgi:hypothetical protein
MNQIAVTIKRAGTGLCSDAAPLVMTVDPDRTRLAATAAPPTTDDADAFLQERLAYVGKVYALIGDQLRKCDAQGCARFVNGTRGA